jgi:hypothetical protein
MEVSTHLHATADLKSERKNPASHTISVSTDPQLVWTFWEEISIVPAGIWAGITQLIQRLATSWKVRGSNPGNWLDFPHPSRPHLEPKRPTIQIGNGCLCSGVKRPRSGPDHRLQLLPRLMKETSYTSTPPWTWNFIAFYRVKFILSGFKPSIL